MKEVCYQFGERRALAGIATEPATRSRIGCVLINAGVVAKTGPYRLYVQLARRLARDGFVTLRFDLSGVGDSRHQHTSQPLRTRTATEIKAAIDELTRRYELDGVVIGGLCSGAEDAFRYAEHDFRVRGVVLIDPFSYHTAGFAWRSLLQRASRKLLCAARIYEPITLPNPTTTKVVAYKYMELSESSRILRAMIARRGRVHFIYTGGQQDTFNHAGQVAAMFETIAFNGLVTVDYFPHMDHTQLFEEDRRTMVEAIGKQLAATWTSTPATEARS